MAVEVEFWSVPAVRPPIPLDEEVLGCFKPEPGPVSRFLLSYLVKPPARFCAVENAPFGKVSRLAVSEIGFPPPRVRIAEPDRVPPIYVYRFVPPLFGAVVGLSAPAPQAHAYLIISWASCCFRYSALGAPGMF